MWASVRPVGVTAAPCMQHAAYCRVGRWMCGSDSEPPGQGWDGPAGRLRELAGGAPERVAGPPRACALGIASVAAAAAAAGLRAAVAAAARLRRELPEERSQVNAGAKVPARAKDDNAARAGAHKILERGRQAAPHGPIDGIALGGAVEHQLAHAVGAGRLHFQALEAGRRHRNAARHPVVGSALGFAGGGDGRLVRRQRRRRRESACRGRVIASQCLGVCLRRSSRAAGQARERAREGHRGAQESRLEACTRRSGSGECTHAAPGLGDSASCPAAAAATRTSRLGPAAPTVHALMPAVRAAACLKPCSGSVSINSAIKKSEAA